MTHYFIVSFFTSVSNGRGRKGTAHYMNEAHTAAIPLELKFGHIRLQ